MLRILFVEPEIPGNTGNAIRLAAVTGAELHVVEPIGFNFQDAHLRRAGLDYHDLAVLTVHPSLETAWEALDPRRVFAFTTTATTPHTQIQWREDDVLMFGKESAGLSEEHKADPHVTGEVRIPMLAARRSLNLANAASIAVYEAWRQLDFAGAQLPEVNG
ncbi:MULTISPECIES: tRNA (cytidine(34)-2'-O)-methyltransferase [Kocuria]|uniref:Putative tRNA (cytidine(34)-2'-O)-methyltransferase n=1 Tax=Kocuria subflava TaxID=1736139 RepID=A0A846U6Z1_9MICC|nr:MULTISPECIES: tRNA (cytidine(34)-2'-O)-methyltransferase [Kocuria]NKE10551.1 tRNA (cytidine(34)-2'-O)-methyltransferase [Kocuria subflava]